MTGLTVVDELQAYLLRIKHELNPCVEHIARINTNIQTIEHSCCHSPQQPCVRRQGSNLCKFDFNTTLLPAPTPFARHRAIFILSNVALALGVKPAVDRNIIAWFLWNTGAKSDCDLLRPSTNVLQDATTLFATCLESLGCLSSGRIDPRSSLLNLFSHTCALNKNLRVLMTMVETIENASRSHSHHVGCANSTYVNCPAPFDVASTCGCNSLDECTTLSERKRPPAGHTKDDTRTIFRSKPSALQYHRAIAVLGDLSSYVRRIDSEDDSILCLNYTLIPIGQCLMDIAGRIEHTIHAWAFEHGCPESLHMADASDSRRGDAQESDGEPACRTGDPTPARRKRAFKARKGPGEQISRSTEYHLEVRKTFLAILGTRIRKKTLGDASCSRALQRRHLRWRSWKLRLPHYLRRRRCRTSQRRCLPL